MSIVAAFGDDDHTAADGPYVRVMKVRKWLYIFGACAFILSLRLYDGDAVYSLLKVVKLPSWLLVQVVAPGIAYLLLQYGLLGGQLFRTYDIILNERLAYRRADELAKTIDRLNTAKLALQTHHRKILESLNPALYSAREKFNQAEHGHFAALAEQDKFSSITSNFTRKIADELKSTHLRRVKTAENALNLAEHELQVVEKDMREATSEDWVTQNEGAAALVAEISEAENSLKTLKNDDPADRKNYRQFEISVDLLRILPPPLFAISALLSLIRLAP